MNYKSPPILAPISFLKNRRLTHAVGVTAVTIVMASNHLGEPQFYPAFKVFCLEMFCYLTVTYIGLLVLIPKYLYTSRFWAFIGSSILLSVVFSYIEYKLTWWILRGTTDITGLYVFTLLSADALFLCLITAVKVGKDLLIVQYENAIVQREKLQQELNFLRAQLSPHFLLNTINNLYGLSVVQSEQLPNLMLRLSDLLRYSLYDTKTDNVSLKGEVQYLLDYIELQRIRLSSRVELKVAFPIEILESLTIVPLLLVVFVENAFKYAQSSGTDHRLFIHLTMSVNADKLCFVAENSFKKREVSQGDFVLLTEGIGLNTTLRRIELLYGTKSLPIITTDNGCYRVELKLNLTHAKN